MDKVQVIQAKAKKELSKAHSNAEIIWSFIDKEIEQPEALLHYCGNPVIYPNTNIVIQGKTGSHKSRFAAALGSLILMQKSGRKMYGFSKENDWKVPVLYVDTERNKTEQLPMMLKALVEQTGLEKEELKDCFTILPLSESPRNLRLKILGEEINRLNAKQTHEYPLVVILDVVSDFSSDFNSVAETNSISDIMSYANSKFGSTIISIIHENPGEGEKARGHLGTELSNKASTIFQISEVKLMDGVFRLKMLKSRTTPLYGEVLLKFDSVANNLVVITDESIRSKVLDFDIFKLGKALSDNEFETIGRIELIGYLEKALSWKTRKIEDKLKRFVNEEIRFDSSHGPSILIKERAREVIYRRIAADLPQSNEDSADNEWNPFSEQFGSESIEFEPEVEEFGEDDYYEDDYCENEMKFHNY